MNLNQINFIRKKLKNGEPSIGTWMQIGSSAVAEIIGDSGYDWVSVDLEHGSIDTSNLPNLFRAIKLGGALPLARVSESTPGYCKKALDAGAGGVILPMIENEIHLKKIISSCQWPPKGNRGVGFSRANLYGKYFDRYIEESQIPIVIAQIENTNGVNNLDKILQVNGLDAIMVGPYDLSASMGLTSKFENQKFLYHMLQRPIH